MKPSHPSLLLSLLLIVYPLAAQTDNPIQLSPFEVQTDKDVGYYASNSLSATKTNVPLQNLPMNIQVMTRTFLDDINANRIEDAMAYAAGVSQSTNEPGRFALRGFTNPNPMRNGLDTLSETNFVSTLTLERIEVVKGPAAILYGITEPGGLINMITKKPRFTASGSISTQAGSYSSRGVALDTTGPLGGPDAKIAYRLAAGYTDLGADRDWVNDQTLTIAPSLLFQFNPQSSLLLAYEYVELDSVPPGPGVVKVSEDNVRIGWVEEKHYGLSKRFNQQGPDAKKDTATSYLSADFQHRFGDDRYALRAVINHTDTSLDQDIRLGGQVERRGPDGELGWIVTHALARWVDRQETAFQGELTARFDHPNVTQRILVGAETTRFEQDQKAFRQNNIVPLMDLKDPSTWNFRIPIAPEDRALRPADFLTKQETSSAYLVHQAELADSRLHTMLGLRYDVVDSRTLNRRLAVPTWGATPTTNHWTPQAGLLYKVVPSIATFLSYSESFSPNTAVNPDGSMFSPATGEGWDLGVKYNSPDGRFNATVSVFDIRKTNIVRQDIERRLNDPEGRIWFISSGVERSKGFEADFILTPHENYQLTLSYANIDAYVESNVETPAQEGLPLGETPRHNFALWNKYSFGSGAMSGFYVAAGINYRGDAKLDLQPANATLSTPAYTTLNLVFGYKNTTATYPWEIAVRCNNVTDELYFQRQRWYADGRNVQFTARVNF